MIDIITLWMLLIETNFIDYDAIFVNWYLIESKPYITEDLMKRQYNIKL